MKLKNETYFFISKLWCYFFIFKISILSISRDEFFKLSGLLRVPKIWSNVVFPAQRTHYSGYLIAF